MKTARNAFYQRFGVDLAEALRRMPPEEADHLRRITWASFTLCSVPFLPLDQRLALYCEMLELLRADNFTHRDFPNAYSEAIDGKLIELALGLFVRIR
jgi:hypothetical protein